MVLERNSNHRLPPRVFHFVIERNAVLFYCQTTGVRQGAGHVRVILTHVALPFRAPLRSIRRPSTESKSGGIVIESSVQSSATVKAALRIAAVEIMRHA